MNCAIWEITIIVVEHDEIRFALRIISGCWPWSGYSCWQDSRARSVPAIFYDTKTNFADAGLFYGEKRDRDSRRTARGQKDHEHIKIKGAEPPQSQELGREHSVASVYGNHGRSRVLVNLVLIYDVL